MATFDGLASVNITLGLGTAFGQTQSFNIPLVVLPHNLSTNRLDVFSSVNSVVEAGAAVNSPVYRFVAGFFNGKFPSSLVKVARANVDEITLTIGSNIPEVGEDVSVNIKVNGVASVVSYTRLVGDGDAAAIATGLAGALTTAFPNDGDNPQFSAVGATIETTIGTHKVSIGWNSLDDDGVPHIAVLDSTTESLVDVIGLATVVDNDYHFLMAESRAQADVVALGDFGEANDKQYFTGTSDLEVADNADLDNIATVMGDKAQNAVSMMFHTKDQFYFPEATIVGGIANLDPYRLQNPNFMTLSGIPVDYLSESQIVTLTQRNVNFYVKEDGFSVYKEGWNFGSNFIDTIRNTTWAKVRIRETLTALLKKQADLGSALPYSDTGAAMMESRIRNDVINVGIRGGSIATGKTTDPDTGSTIDLNPIVRAGTRAQQTNADIAARTWRNVFVEYVYISGVNKIKVNLNVILNRDPA